MSVSTIARIVATVAIAAGAIALGADRGALFGAGFIIAIAALATADRALGLVLSGIALAAALGTVPQDMPATAPWVAALGGLALACLARAVAISWPAVAREHHDVVAALVLLAAWLTLFLPDAHAWLAGSDGPLMIDVLLRDGSTAVRAPTTVAAIVPFQAPMAAIWTAPLVVYLPLVALLLLAWTATGRAVPRAVRFVAIGVAALLALTGLVDTLVTALGSAVDLDIERLRVELTLASGMSSAVEQAAAAPGAAVTAGWSQPLVHPLRLIAGVVAAFIAWRSAPSLATRAATTTAPQANLLVMGASGFAVLTLLFIEPGPPQIALLGGLLIALGAVVTAQDPRLGRGAPLAMLIATLGVWAAGWLLPMTGWITL